MAARRSYGTGSLYPSDNGLMWIGHWRANGRQIKRTVGPRRAEGATDGLTRKQAEAKLRELISTVTAAKPVGQRMTVETAGERYRQHLKRAGRKRSHLAFVETAFRCHLTPFFEGRSLDAIRHEDVADLVAVLEGRGLAPKTIRNYVGTLTALFNFAMGPQRRWASASPCVGVELPGVPDDAEIRFLDEAEWEAVLRHVQPGPYEAIDRALLPHGPHGRAAARGAVRAPVARRRLARRPRPRPPVLGARGVRHTQEPQGLAERPDG